MEQEMQDKIAICSEIWELELASDEHFAEKSNGLQNWLNGMMQIPLAELEDIKKDIVFIIKTILDCKERGKNELVICSCCNDDKLECNRRDKDGNVCDTVICMNCTGYEYCRECMQEELGMCS
jgi:hypothetical protein